MICDSEYIINTVELTTAHFQLFAWPSGRLSPPCHLLWIILTDSPDANLTWTVLQKYTQRPVSWAIIEPDKLTVLLLLKTESSARFSVSLLPPVLQ